MSIDPSILSSLGLKPDNYFEGITRGAKRLAAAEKKGGPIPDDLDFSVQEVCVTCNQNIPSSQKPLRCSACKAVLYCSKACAVRDWNQPAVPNAPTHKMLCADNKRHMERISENHKLINSFPWGRIEKDGSTNTEVVRGRFDVLGGSDFGFWSHRGGPIPHANMGQIASMFGSSPYAAEIAKIFKGYEHLDGKDLLKQKHLSDEEGWKLPPPLIPYRNFASPKAKRPILITESAEPVTDWDSWYRWRGLPKESPVALLLNFPLSVYQLLVHCLEVTNPKLGSPDKRISLEVHIIGLEVELNYLPAFTELALLLPYHDIKLIGFGSSVHKLIAEAKKTKPTSLAAQTDINTPVFDYTSPDEIGGSTLSIHLDGSSETWPHPTSAKDAPDALVACNAGLASYREWVPVIQLAHVMDIPFGVTEYTEQSLETQRSSFPRILWGTPVKPKSVDEYKIEMNPFRLPGQRGLPAHRLPNMVHGFTMVVNKKVKAQEELENALNGLDLD